jgi:hypothetical protein
MVTRQPFLSRSLPSLLALKLPSMFHFIIAFGVWSV